MTTDKLDLDGLRAAIRMLTPTMREWITAVIAALEAAPQPSAGEAARIIDLLLAAGFIDKHKVEQARAIAAWSAAPQPAAAQWQPIETAPKDGTPILLRSKKNRMADGMWVAVNSEKGYWAWSMVNQEPTHWQPLPAPPCALSGSGENEEQTNG